MRRDAESPEVVRCTNMRGCTLPQQAPVAPEREGAGETVEGTAVVQRHFMRKYERRSTIESRSPVTANESDGRLEATAQMCEKNEPLVAFMDEATISAEEKENRMRVVNTNQAEFANPENQNASLTSARASLPSSAPPRRSRSSGARGHGDRSEAV